MSAFQAFDSFVEALAEQVHYLRSDQLALALTNVPPDLVANSRLADLSEISYANLSNRNVTTLSSAQTLGTYRLIVDDLDLKTSGPVEPFQWIVLYNDTATHDELISLYDLGSPVELGDKENFTIKFGNGGVVRLGRC